MSPSSCTKIVEELSNSYNKDALLWKNEISKVVINEVVLFRYPLHIDT